MGEPGAGKSRLIHEFKAGLPGHCKVLEAHAVSHSKTSPWLPVIELLKGCFALATEDNKERRREKVETGMSSLDPALADTLPYLLSLLGDARAGVELATMDAQVRRRRTHEALKRLVLRDSLNRPLVVIFEDLHWIDEETQRFLETLVDGIVNARVLLLVNYRPEYSHPWGNRSYYTQLRLGPLGAESAREMLDALLGEDPSLQSLKRLVVAETEGNPFFTEEIVQALFEQGVMERDGAVKLVKPLAHVRIPPTVQGMLAARIDALGAADKELLQTLAVIGKDFAFNLIRQMTGRPHEELAAMLRSLQAGEFIYERATADRG